MVEPTTGQQSGFSPDLRRLLSPRSLAVIGESRTCRNVAEANRKLGFTGEIVAVNPTRDLEGVTTYRTIADLPKPPDAAFVAVRPDLTAPVVSELAQIGAGGAVVYTAGFAEAGERGAAQQDELVATAGAMPFLGPNCYGLLNYLDGVAIWPDQHGGRVLAEEERGIGLVAQSSSIAISMTMQRLGVPIAAVLTVGNGAMVDAAELGRLLVSHPRVSAVGMLVESLADLRGWEALAQESRHHGVGVVALVLGRSEQAKRVTLSHSASMASDADTGSAFLRRLGIGEVTCVDALLGALSLLHCGGPLSGSSLASLSCSGGEASLMADSAAGRDVHFPALDDRQRAGLATALGPRVTLDNPLDYHTYVWTDRPAMTAAFTAMTAGSADLNLLYCDLPHPDRCDDSDWLIAVDAFTDALDATGSRGAVVAAMGSNLDGPHAEEWVRRGLPLLAPPRMALDAAEAALAIGTAWSTPPPQPLAGPRPATRDRTLDEVEAKEVLRRSGAPVLPSTRCRTVDDAITAATTFPAVVKGIGAAHKSELGGVRIGLADASEVASAASALLGRFQELLVEPMIIDGVAELLVSVDTDPTFGPVLSLGWGGVLTEVHQDVRRLPLPATDTEMLAALRDLRCWPLLAGYRGTPPADLDSVLRAIHSITAAVLSGTCHDVEVNPLIVTPTSAWVADALVTQAEDDVRRTS